MNDDNENKGDRKVVATNDETRTAQNVQNDVEGSKSKSIKTGEEGNE